MRRKKGDVAREAMSESREGRAPDVSSYEGLLAEIKKLIAEARAKGVPLFERDDLLECRACGAYEDVTFKGEHVIMLKKRRRTRQGTEFVVLSRKQRRRSLQDGGVRYFITYEFLCGMCGVHQTAKLTEDFGPWPRPPVS